MIKLVYRPNSAFTAVADQDNLQKGTGEPHKTLSDSSPSKLGPSEFSPHCDWSRAPLTNQRISKVISSIPSKSPARLGPSPSAVMAPTDSAHRISRSHSIGKQRPEDSQSVLHPSPRLFTTERNRDKGVVDTSDDDDDDDDSHTLLFTAARKRRRTSLTPRALHAMSPRFDGLTSDEDNDDDADNNLNSLKPFTLSASLPGTEMKAPRHTMRSAMRRRRSLLPLCNKTARERCLEYIITGIDAAWAEYCDSTSNAELQLYSPCSPASEGDIQAHSPRHHSLSADPASAWLLNLKKRMQDAKDVMVETVDSSKLEASTRFWNCWDAIKYSVIELVEGEDENVDSVVDKLESGRFYS